MPIALAVWSSNVGVIRLNLFSIGGPWLKTHTFLHQVLAGNANNGVVRGLTWSSVGIGRYFRFLTGSGPVSQVSSFDQQRLRSDEGYCP